MRPQKSFDRLPVCFGVRELAVHHFKMCCLPSAGIVVEMRRVMNAQYIIIIMRACE